MYLDLFSLLRFVVDLGLAIDSRLSWCLSSSDCEQRLSPLRAVGARLPACASVPARDPAHTRAALLTVVLLWR